MTEVSLSPPGVSIKRVAKASFYGVELGAVTLHLYYYFKIAVIKKITRFRGAMPQFPLFCVALGSFQNHFF
jgi:hypothetical protein